MSTPPQTVEAKMGERKPLRMSYEEFLAWADEDTYAEWVAGEACVYRPRTNAHQILLGFLLVVLNAFVKVRQLGRVCILPFELKIHPEANSREPDLMFIAKEHLDRLTPERVSGPPDLIVEIISDDSVHRDRVDKFDEYEAGGVAEYWIIDNRPERRRAQFYQLDEYGQYQLMSVGADGTYRSRVLPGFWLKLDWLWETPPNELRAIAAIIGPEQMLRALQHAAEQKPS